MYVCMYVHTYTCTYILYIVHVHHIRKSDEKYIIFIEGTGI